MLYKAEMGKNVIKLNNFISKSKLEKNETLIELFKWLCLRTRKIFFYFRSPISTLSV